jgi:hypothetical protein
MLMNIHNAPTKGNFCNQQGNIMKPRIVEDYNCHMDYVDKGDGITNSHTISTPAHGNGQIIFPCVRFIPNSCIAMR